MKKIIFLLIILLGFANALNLTSFNTDYFNSYFITNQTNSNYFTATGSIDWNTQKDYSYNGTDWDNNLLFYAKFNSQTNNITKESKNGCDGNLINGAILSKGIFDTNALYVNRDLNQHVNFCYPPDFNAEVKYSFSIWFRSTKGSVYTDFGTILSDSYFDNNYKGVALGIANTNKLQLELVDSWSPGPQRGLLCRGNQEVNDGKWHHAIVTYNGNYLDCSGTKFYIDGLEVPTETTSSSLTVQDHNIKSGEGLTIGSQSPNIYEFTGFIDELKI